jgi:ribosomal protein S18 acetylase RimI-like enzyme
MTTPDRDLRIDDALPDDYAWCARIMAATDPWITLGRDVASCAATLRRPGTDLLVARQVADRVGFVLVAATGLAGSPYVAAIAVAPDARGRGVGAAMIRCAERRVPGARNLFLCVSDFNAAARAFYARLGFQQVGVLDDYVIEGHAEILLRKRLA